MFLKLHGEGLAAHVLQEAAAKDPALKEIYRGAEYIAYQETGAEAVYTFSQAAQGLAHPAAICRKPVKDGDNMIIQMVIVCRGETSSCQALESDFKLLNAQMEAEIRNKAADTAAKK